ncbi:hypothetical protein I302_103256 [Kwoniella bestiolae CBS 10118]|uniref:NFD4 C-terminal domain-containing protein n=1 Tax=Kwoniella bestiolae CBS 10118 TaxID=1296100 RepID=A0A1B9G812_9TREE|nr:hypothetical protein I302_01955 [Kwoniella bestiolae CBS 10118]OCF27120.1 hypothetical protein I302_01955 [Kwoniella bestiolae CBS 10118]
MSSSPPLHPSTTNYTHEPQPPPPMTPLDPPDIPAILRSKRSWKRQITSMDLPRPLHIGLTCFSIGISAVTANGVYCWGTYGPVVARLLELDGTEAQTIVVGGILGVYLCAAPLGALTDKYGPRTGSLVSACFGVIGYQSFSAILRRATPDTPYVHLWLTAAYFLVGAATVGSYFACLTCASLSFPTHPTLALSLPLSLIGLSALVLSSFSSLSMFSEESTTDLDPARFLAFLGILTPSINIFGWIFMKVIPQPELFGEIKLPEDIESRSFQPDEEDEDEDEGDMGEMSESIGQLLRLDERTPMLIGGIPAAWEEVEMMEQGKDNWTARDLVLDYKGFWAFGLLLALIIGPGEMVVASIGSIITSLLPPTSLNPSSLVPNHLTNPISTLELNPLKLRNKHVFLLSLTSTLSRLITGVLADYLAPPLTATPNPAHKRDPTEPSHLFIRKRPVRLSRSAFAAISGSTLGLVFAWSAGYLTGKGEDLSVLSAGTGAMYGAIFTLVPAIVSHHYGPTNFGLAWGMISYFAALGSVVYSYLYAYLSVPDSGNPSDQCYGPHCFRMTFIVCAISCFVGSVGVVILGRTWKV